MRQPKNSAKELIPKKRIIAFDELTCNQIKKFVERYNNNFLFKLIREYTTLLENKDKIETKNIAGLTQTIKIKRSIKMPVPDYGMLTMGEMAYTEVGEERRLFIGMADDKTPFEIAGSNYALLNSPNFIGSPTAPTLGIGNYSTKIATTEFVEDSITFYITSIQTESVPKPTEDGNYIFVIEPSDELPKNVNINDIAALYKGEWYLIYSFEYSPAAINVGFKEIQTYIKVKNSWQLMSVNSSPNPMANTVGQWDDNVNFSANNYSTFVSVNTTSVQNLLLYNTSAGIQLFIGSLSQTIILPDATTFANNGFEFRFKNESLGVLTIKTNKGNTVTTINPSTDSIVTLINNSTSEGVWHAPIPINTMIGVTIFYGLRISRVSDTTYNHLLLDTDDGNFTLNSNYSDTIMLGKGVKFYVNTNGHLIATF